MSFHLKALAAALFFPTAAVLGAAIPFSETIRKRAQPEGISVSFYENNVNWQEVAASGHSFAYIVASGGYGHQNTAFSSQFADAAAAGLIRGAYHIAIFSESSGADQANYFLSNGGNWINDGRTLPGAIKVGYDTDQDDCYGLDVTSTVDWIRDFSTTYHAQVNFYPVIHTTTHWWNTCTGGSTDFGGNPLWIIHQGDTVDALPSGWSDYTFWQYGNPVTSSDGKERFNGDQAGLQGLAANPSART